jgi:hypothetical protein
MLHRPSVRAKAQGHARQCAVRRRELVRVRFRLSRGEGQEKVTLPRKHPTFLALFYPQMY